MPPEGYTSVSLSDDVIGKLARVMATTECDSLACAVEFSAELTLDELGEATPAERESWRAHWSESNESSH